MPQIELGFYRGFCCTVGELVRRASRRGDDTYGASSFWHRQVVGVVGCWQPATTAINFFRSL
jgi:hypothetical protein